MGIPPLMQELLINFGNELELRHLGLAPDRARSAPVALPSRAAGGMSPAVTLTDPLMTSDEYRAAIAELGLSQIAAGRLLGVDPRTSRKWACGETGVSEPAARMLRLMIAARITRERALKLIGKED